MSEDFETTIVTRDHLGTPTHFERRFPALSILEPGANEPRVLRVEDELVIGSAPGLAVRLEDPRASRMHAQIELRDDGAWITDLSSLNGTWVESVRVERARLHHGAWIHIGGSRIRVDYEAHPTPVKLWPVDSFGPLLGRSVAMRQVFHQLDRAARSDATTLILGETGTGKDLAARAIHEASDRARAPMSVIDCGALSPQLLESELFGHVRGAFTGAIGDRPGAIEAADGGTVFLDEIGELLLELQPKLLRVLESRTVRRVGENEPRPVDVRFVAATHRDLRSMVNEGSFREDLYFRLAVLSVRLPPLRKRSDDLPMLVERLLPEGSDVEVDDRLLSELRTRAWRGNIRELRNHVERLALFGRELPPGLLTTAAEAALPDPPLDRPFHEVRAEWVDHLELRYLRGILERSDGNIAEAARSAGLNRSYLYRLLKKHSLT